MDTIKRILITAGEPAGIGPDVTIKLAQENCPAELVVIADPDLLAERAKQLGLPLQLTTCELSAQPTTHKAGTLKIIPISLNAAVIAGQLNPLNADYVLRTLETAATLCLEKKANAVVTAPVHKEIMNQAGISFTGHTEFFAQHAHVPHTVMLFVADKLKVALATTHLPLAAVPAAITKERLHLVLNILHTGLREKFHIATPKILICGLNPHAGEGGYLGREEIDVIIPALNELRKHYDLIGPLPADTIFTPKHLATADAVLSMYHDQALPLVKYASFGHAVNVTLGLPYIRTSVDHGTALDIAGTGTADLGSMRAALDVSLQMLKV